MLSPQCHSYPRTLGIEMQHITHTEGFELAKNLSRFYECMHEDAQNLISTLRGFLNAGMLRHHHRQRHQLRREAIPQILPTEEHPTRPSIDRKSTRLNSSHITRSRMPSSA